MAYTNIDDPSAHFQTATYTGGGANTEVTNSGNSDLKPDFLWIKNRTAGYGHFVVDSNRNISYAQNSSNAPYLETESTAAENNNQNWMASVNTNGFTTGISEHINNNSGSAFVAWQWKANGGTTSNLSGNLASVVQVNADAGFSIVKYTGSGGNGQSVNHGLGLTPEVVITKARNGAGDWYMYHKSIGTANFLKLNTTAAQAGSSPYNAADPTSTAFFVSNHLIYVGELGADFVSYCFAPIQGYSKFGSYVGNGSTNGPFVYLGFKPAFVMLKGSSASGSWYMLDSKRDVDNVAHHAVEAQSAAAEYTNYNFIDMLSNGFKLRLGTSEVNTSGNSYIYMAFAENPFTTSTGVPTTAR